MRKALAALLVLGSFPAAAADMLPIKAPPRILVTYVGHGFYYGAGTFAENDKLSANGSGVLGSVGGTYQVGGAVGAVGGYMWGDGTNWKAIEVMASYKNVGVTTMTTSGVPAAFDSRYGFTERFKLGGPITAIVNLLPSLGSVFPAFPLAPAGGIGSTHPYLFGAAHQDPLRTNIGLASGHAWVIKGGFGVGVMQQIGNGFVADVWAEYIPAGGSLTVGLPAAVAQTSVGRESRIGVSILW